MEQPLFHPVAAPLRSRLVNVFSNGRLFLFLTILLGVSGLVVRGLVALGSDDVLDWDETYYASTTSTAAHGYGLYPYALGYERIPHMGGIGYVLYLYVFAYKFIGPGLFGLRVVSFLVGLSAIAGLFVLARKWYGSATGFAALALTPSLLIFQLSNTIRFDVFAIAFVAWALVFYSYAVQRHASIVLHVAVGFVLALGLQVHLHTAAAAFAVGCAYLVSDIRAVRHRTTGRRLALMPVLGFVAGYAIGAMLFVVLNVLPNPHAYFRTAALARLSAADSAKELNLTAPMDASRLAQTFLSPTTIVRKEVVRYRNVVADLSWWEALLWLAALPAFVLFRRAPPAIGARLLLAGAALGAGIVFNSSSPLYAAAIFPFFVPVAASFVTHGFAAGTRIGWSDVSGKSVAVILALAIAILPGLVSHGRAALTRLRQSSPAEAAPAIVTAVQGLASPGCILAGPTELYAKYFMAYPMFLGTRAVEIRIGSTYYGLQDRIVEYWRIKRPDVVFGTPSQGLDTYVATAGYVPIADGVWRAPNGLSAGCVLNPN